MKVSFKVNSFVMNCVNAMLIEADNDRTANYMEWECGYKYGHKSSDRTTYFYPTNQLKPCVNGDQDIFIDQDGLVVIEGQRNALWTDWNNRLMNFIQLMEAYGYAEVVSYESSDSKLLWHEVKQCWIKRASIEEVAEEYAAELSKRSGPYWPIWVQDAEVRLEKAGGLKSVQQRIAAEKKAAEKAKKEAMKLASDRKWKETVRKESPFAALRTLLVQLPPAPPHEQAIVL